jgi:hypothetical protein
MNTFGIPCNLERILELGVTDVKNYVKKKQ